VVADVEDGVRRNRRLCCSADSRLGRQRARGERELEDAVDDVVDVGEIARYLPWFQSLIVRPARMSRRT
jgi:hypothetical protein